MYGARIKELRKQNSLTLKQLGIKVGLSESTISLYEKEKRTPDFEVLNKMATLFNVSVDYILGRTEKGKNTKSLDEQLDGISFALYKGVEDLSDADKKDVLNFVEFIKQKKKNEEK